MVKNIHICDLCGAEYKWMEELAHFEITVKNNRIFRFNEPLWSDKHLRLDICEKCLEKKGFAVGKMERSTEDDKHNEDTLKDKLLEILSELGVEPD